MKADYSMEYGFIIKPGTVVLFDIGAYTRLGMVIEIDDTHGKTNRTVTILEPSGHRRGRGLDYDVKLGSIRPLDRAEARYLRVESWDEWERDNKIT